MGQRRATEAFKKFRFLNRESDTHMSALCGIPWNA